MQEEEFGKEPTKEDFDEIEKGMEKLLDESIDDLLEEEDMDNLFPPSDIEDDIDIQDLEDPDND